MVGGKKAAATEPKPLGRPSSFTQDIADAICERLAKGETLTSICSDEGMPATRTVSDWKKAHESFSTDFARARDEGFDAIAAECLDIADETGGDTIRTKDGERADTEWISRSKLRIETRLKLLSKWDPKRYGDKLELDHKGELGPISITLLRQPPDGAT